MGRMMILAAASLVGTVAVSSSDAVKTEEPDNGQPRQRKPRARTLDGWHPTPITEPKREDYPSRQAWRQDYRRWSDANA